MSDAPSSPNHSFSEEEKHELTPNTKHKTKKTEKLQIIEDGGDESSDSDEETGSEDAEANENDTGNVEENANEEDVDMHQEEDGARDVNEDEEVLDPEIDKEIETR